MRTALSLCAFALAACGARSDLATPPVPTPDAAPSSVLADAGAHPGDAGVEASPPEDAAPPDCEACAGTCVAGRCIVVLAKASALRLAIDATHVYWTTQPTCSGAACFGEIDEVPKAGGPMTTLVAGLRSPMAIATDGSRVYVGTAYELLSEPVGGGVPSVLFGPTLVQRIALDATNVYWTGSGSVSQMPIAGGAPVTIASGQPWPQNVAVDAHDVYWACGGTEPTGYNDGSIATAPIGGGATKVLAKGQHLPDGVGLDADHVYWTSYGPNGALIDARRDGIGRTVLAAQHAYPNQVVVDAASVYWATMGTIQANYADGAIQKMPLGGGPVTTIAAAQPEVVDLVVDDTSAYWITRDAIVKATPK